MIEIDAKLRKGLESAETIVAIHGCDASPIAKVLEIIDAHECPVSGGVSSTLKEDSERYIHSGPSLEGRYLVEKLLAIADAKPGWIDGPPTKTGPYVVELPDGERVFVALKAGWCGFVVGGIDVGLAVRHVYLPVYSPPPKQEPVVEHNEGCKWKDKLTPQMGVNQWHMMGVGTVDIDNCPGCGVPLSELGGE